MRVQIAPGIWKDQGPQKGMGHHPIHLGSGAVAAHEGIPPNKRALYTPYTKKKRTNRPSGAAWRRKRNG